MPPPESTAWPPLIAYDGLYSFGGAVQNKVGPQIMELVRDGADTKVNALVEEFMSSDTQVRSLFRWGMWVFGADGPAAVIRAFDPYTLEGYTPLITCPTLVLAGENDFAARRAGIPALRGSPLPEDLPPLPHGRRRRRTLPSRRDVERASSHLRLARHRPRTVHGTRLDRIP